MSIFLDRLDGLRETGPNRWIARCPAHSDSSPSLSIRELDDGRILIHDFAGCSPHDVLAAVGLQMSDLFPKPLGHRFRPSRSSIPARDLLAVVDHEALTVGFIAEQILKDKRIDEQTWQRLATAAGRISKARHYAEF